MPDTPILVDLSGTTFLMTAETGIIIANFSRTVESETLPVFDGATGYDTGEVYFNFTANYSFSGVINANSGLATAAVGTALTVANTTTGGGVSGGGIYTRTVALEHAAKGMRSITVTAKQNSGIT